MFPACDNVFEALDRTPFARTRVVILGQDPYSQPGQAHGLAFSVPLGVKRTGSLRNIHCELRRDVGIPIPDHGNLDRWAGQGVLLLNTALTVRARQRGSHRGIGWESFTRAIVRVIDTRGDTVFMLWGQAAQKMRKALINTPPNMIIESSHPSPLSAKRGDHPFCGSGPFSRANEELSDGGRGEIDWRLTN